MNRHLYQPTFDKVLAHMRSQGCASLDDGSRCVYREHIAQGQTLMCAIGCLIPDDRYTESIEDCTPSQVFTKKPLDDCGFDWHDGHATLKTILMELGFDAGDQDFLGDLQMAHDTADQDPLEFYDKPSDVPPHLWLAAFESNMRGVAARYHLKYEGPAT
jgi:hypothetical protein